MNDTPLQSTLREMQRLLGAPRTWIVLILAGVVLGVAGPFDTYDEMSIGPRLGYWLAIAICTFFTGVFANNLITRTLIRVRLPRWPALGIGSIFAGILVACVVMALNFLAFGPTAFERFALSSIFVTVVPIAVLLTFAYVLLTNALHPPAETMPDIADIAPRPTRLLERLQPQNRGALVSLSVSDHYVDVITQRGHEMLLIRLSDAMAETEGTPGLQIHRSHWVALDQIAGIVRRNGKIFVATSAGDELPVSRTYHPVLKDAGLLL